MKLDSEKCHLLISCVKQAMWAKTGKDIRWEKSDVKLLGVTIDKNLGFVNIFQNYVLKLIGNLVLYFVGQDFFL